MKRILSILFFCAPVFVIAQGTESVTTGEPMGSSQIVTGLPRAMVRSSKLSDQPVTKDTSVAVPSMTYSNLPGKADFNYDPEKIKAVSLMPKNLLPQLYRFYAKAGIGNYTMPLLDLYFNDLYNKKGTYGAKYHHLSSNAGIKNAGYSGFADNEIGVYGKTFIQKSELGGSIDYNRNMLHYYGFDPDSFKFSKDTTRQFFNYIGANAYYGTYYPDSVKINHREELKYYYFNDRYGANENYIHGSTKLNKRVGRELYGLNFDFNYNHFVPNVLFQGCTSCLEEKQLGSAQQNFLATLNPHIQSNGKNWVAKVGLAVAMDVYDGSSYFHFYPDVEFRYSLFHDILVPYAGINGGMKRNSYKLLVGQNPFIISDFQIQNTNNQINVYGGFKGTISSNLSFNTQIAFTKIQNMAFFVTDTLYSVENKFNVIYDNVDQLSINGQLNYQQSEKLKILARGEFFNYSTTNEVKAWMMPNFKVTLGGIYDLYDKIIVHGDVFVIGTRYAKSLRPVDGVTAGQGVYAIKLKPFVDVNLGVEYRYTKRISAFVNFNNIAAQRYQYWYKYPVMGINIMGGATFSF